MNSRVTWNVLPGAVVSDYKHSAGARLIAIELPITTAADIGFFFSSSAGGAGYKPVYTNIHAGAAAKWNLGAAGAVTEARVIPVPEELGRLIGVGYVALAFSVAQAAGGAVIGHIQRDP